MSRIAPHLENFKGFYEEVSSMRHYPYANGANILGYLSEVTQAEIDNDKFYKPGGRIGRSGIERYYESQFRGEKGVKYIVTFCNEQYDRSRLKMVSTTLLRKQAPPIQLGLDVLLQAYGEKLSEK